MDGGSRESPGLTALTGSITICIDIDQASKGGDSDLSEIAVAIDRCRQDDTGQDLLAAIDRAGQNNSAAILFLAVIKSARLLQLGHGVAGAIRRGQTVKTVHARAVHTRRQIDRIPGKIGTGQAKMRGCRIAAANTGVAAIQRAIIVGIGIDRAADRGEPIIGKLISGLIDTFGQHNRADGIEGRASAKGGIIHRPASRSGRLAIVHMVGWLGFSDRVACAIGRRQIGKAVAAISGGLNGCIDRIAVEIGPGEGQRN